MLNGRLPIRIVLASWASLLVVSGCSSQSSDPPAASIQTGPTLAADAAGDATAAVAVPVQVRASTASRSTPAQAEPVSRAPEVVLKTSIGDVRVRLNPDKAPVTVDNFLTNYVERGFYEGTVFHYVDRGFMIAAGGYTAALEPKAARAYIRNEANNGLKNKRGTIAMIRDPDHADSATSQFFINLSDNAGLDPHEGEGEDAAGYCVFGEVVEGMDVVDRIAAAEVADRNQFPKTPVTPIVIESVKWLR